MFGLAYGAGVMIQAVKDDGVSKKDVTLAFIFLVACHAVVEDTLIFIPLGIPVLPLLMIRLVTAIILTLIVAAVWKRNEIINRKESCLMNKQITTLLFDLDGTLIDTNELIVTSYLHTLEKYYPGRFTREDVLPFMGPPLMEVFSGIDAEKVDEMIKVYRKYNDEQHDLLVTEFYWGI